MKQLILFTISLLLTLCANHNKLFAQTDEISDNNIDDNSTKEKQYKNTVWFNITNPLIISEKSLIFGYERMLPKQQSFTINFGLNALSGISIEDFNENNPEIQLNKDASQKGFNLSVDYRFYIASVNKYDAPRGVYIGPYYSYNNFKNENSWTLNTASFAGNVNTDLVFDIHTVGAELGYQFILWKRLALDFVLFGPGLARYKLETELGTTLTAEDQSELFILINDYLEENIPGYNQVIDGEGYKKSGTAKTTDLGFRYMIHLGYRF